MNDLRAKHLNDWKPFAKSSEIKKTRSSSCDTFIGEQGAFEVKIKEEIICPRDGGSWPMSFILYSPI